MGFMDRQILGSSVVEGVQDTNLFDECCIYLEMKDLSKEERQELLESKEFAALEAKGLIGKKTIVKLKKEDDLERRETMMAFQLAKEADDPLWSKLALNRVKERELIGKIQTKYGQRANRAARIAQKDYIKKIKSGQFVKKDDIDNRT
jgi:hypothetical protein